MSLYFSDFQSRTESVSFLPLSGEFLIFSRLILCSCLTDNSAVLQIWKITQIGFIVTHTLEGQTSTISQGTGKSFSEALIFSSTNPQYDKRLSIEFTSSVHENSQPRTLQNMFCNQIVLNVKTKTNNLCTKHVLWVFWAWNFHALNW